MAARQRKVNKAKLALFLILAFVLTNVMVVFASQQGQLMEYDRKVKELNLKLAEQKERNAALRAERELVGTPEHKERIVRERSGLVRPDEIIFVDATAN